MSYIEAFNRQIINLLKELSHIYPNNGDLKELKNEIFLLTKTFPKKIIHIYYKSLYPYNEYISNEDETFFIDMDLKGTTIESFEYVKHVWENASDENKKIIWKYFQVLNKLTEKYYNLR